MSKEANELTKKAFEWWARAIKAIAGYRCEICGSNKGIDAHHIKGRSPLRLGLSLSNGICLCVEHHRAHVHSTDAKEQQKMKDKIIELRGIEAYQRLERIKHESIEKIYPDKLKFFISQFKHIIKQYEGDNF